VRCSHLINKYKYKFQCILLITIRSNASKELLVKVLPQVLRTEVKVLPMGAKQTLTWISNNDLSLHADKNEKRICVTGRRMQLIEANAITADDFTTRVKLFAVGKQ